MKAISVILLSIVALGVAQSGINEQTRVQDNLGNYAFSYDEGHSGGGTFRKEVGNTLGNKAGSYGLRDIDGRVRIVNYVADATGFRADIKTNEPGVDASQNPADVSINKDILATHSAPIAPIAPTIAPYSSPITYHTAINSPLLHYNQLALNGFTYNSAIDHNAGFTSYPSFGAI